MIYDLPIQIYPSFIHWSYFGSRATFATVCGSGTRCGGVDNSASCEIPDFGVDRLEAPDLRLGSGLGSLRGSPVCAGARPGPGLWTQCPHNPHHCPHLKRGHPKGGERDTRMVGDNIVAGSPGSPLWSRWRPNPVHHQSSRILGQVRSYSQEIMFTLSAVEQKYLGMHFRSISGKCWAMHVCVYLVPHIADISPHLLWHV